MTTAEILNELSHDVDLSGSVANLEGTYIEPLAATMPGHYRNAP